VPQPSTVLAHGLWGQEYPLASSITEHTPFTVTEGASETPSGDVPLTSNIGAGSVGFAGKLVATYHWYWYRGWHFEAQAPSLPVDGDVHYAFYLFCDAWWYATTVSFDAWLDLLVTTIPAPLAGGDRLCETFLVIDLGWPGDPNIGATRRWVYITGQMPARAGNQPRIGFNTHVYAGVTAGEASIRGGFMPHDRDGLRLDDPWPPPHAGELRYVLRPQQVLAAG
jgi:hypothetical protein